jgi:hypothetical protein
MSKVVEYIAQRGARQCGLSVSNEQKGKFGCSRHAPSYQGVRLYRTAEDVQEDQVDLLGGAEFGLENSGRTSSDASENDLLRLFCCRCSEPRDEKPVLRTARLSLRVVISDPYRKVLCPGKRTWGVAKNSRRSISIPLRGQPSTPTLSPSYFLLITS